MSACGGESCVQKASQPPRAADRLAGRVRGRQEQARAMVREGVLPESAAADAEC